MSNMKIVKQCSIDKQSHILKITITVNPSYSYRHLLELPAYLSKI